MSLISENIKFLRKKNGMTQDDLASELGIKRSLIGAYEEGRADPRIENLTKIANAFRIAIDSLITSDLTVTDEKFTSRKTDKTPLRILSITIDKENKENIHLVPQKAAAGYLNGYADPEYISELPRFQLPMLPQNASYRAFEISGDSMLPLESGTVVVGQYVETLDSIKDGKTYVLVTGKEGVVFKRIFNYVKDKGKLFLVSDNKSYSSYDIPAEDVLEIWEAKAYISVKFPDPNENQNVSIESLASIVMELKDEVAKLKSK